MKYTYSPMGKYGRGGRSKYGNKKYGGYASKKEYERAQQLKIMERQGLIKHLREQVKYELIPAQYGDGGLDLKGRPVKVCIMKSCSYVADFVYELEGREVVEDVKGYKTAEYKIKKKLMLWRYGILIKEI